MLSPGSPNALFMGAAASSVSGYQVARSLRGRSAAQTYMNRTPGVAGNQKTWTFSTWVKRGLLGSGGPYCLFSGGTSTTVFEIRFGTSDQLEILYTNSATLLQSTQVFRDMAAWGNLVVACDTNQSVNQAKVRVFWNGSEIVSWATDNRSALGTGNTNMNQAAVHTVFRYSAGASEWFDGYMAQTAFVDGLQLLPSYFGTTDATTGQWIPKDLSTGITWGTNGFWLKYADNSSVAALGTDSSGNSNTWTVNLFSVTAGTTNDSLTDTPTNYGTDTGAGGEVRGNYATLNPLYNSSITYGSGNLAMTSGLTSNTMMGTFGMSSGKWYWEIEWPSGSSTGVAIGVATDDWNKDAELGYNSPSSPSTVEDYYYYAGNGNKGSGQSASGAVTAYGNSYTVADVIGVALDMDNKKIWFRKNGTWQASGDPVAGTNAAYTTLGALTFFPAIGNWSAAVPVLHMNFGQRPFANSAPSGFKALCTQNLATPAVVVSNQHFNAYTYTGNGGNQFIGDPVPQPIDSYQFANGLRFQSANLCYMARSVAVAGNQQKWTFSAWVKRTKLATTMYLFEDQRASGTTYVSFDSTDTIRVQLSDGTTAWYQQTNAVYRDVQNWHHIVVAIDTTNATAGDRQRIYFDGVEITSFSTDQNVPQNTNTTINASGGGYYMGRWASGNYFDGYVAQAAFVDGQQLTPSSFGTTDANGNWIPKDLSSGITWGTNGFWLPFTNVSTTATLGNDSSGNSNTFTTSGFSVTAGTGYDPLTDCPASYGSDTGAGGVVHANYNTWSPLQASSNLTFSKGNLKGVYTGAANPYGCWSTLPFTSGKWYAEFLITTGGSAYPWLGLACAADVYGAQADYDPTYYWDCRAGTTTYKGNVITSGLTTAVSNDIGMVAIDADNGKIWWGLNGTWFSSGNPATGANPGASFSLATGPFHFAQASVSSRDCEANFGQRAYTYTAPSGFKSLCTANMVADSQIVSTPDIAWIKTRNTTSSWVQADSTRGIGLYLSSDSTAAEVTDVNSVQGFTFNGIYIGNASILNTLNNTYVAYLWNKSATCGVDIVNYTSGAANQTINHSLGVAPAMIIVKNRSNVTSMVAYHKAMGATVWFYINGTSAPVTSAQEWNNTEPTSSVFTVGSTSANSNFNAGSNNIAWLFAEIAGFSKFGKYTGNGSTDGPFVYCGFRPRFVMCRAASGVESWIILDTARDTENPDGLYIYASLTNGDGGSSTSDYFDILSNGFKIRTTGASSNSASTTYVFAAFAESPFNYSRAR